ALLVQFTNSADEVFEVGIAFNGFTPETLYKYDTTGYEYVKDSIFYNTRRDFIYRELPTLEVVTAGDTLFSGESIYGNVASEDLTIDLEQLPYPTFFTNDFYQLEIRANEIYTNKDNGLEIEIPVTDGNIIVNNGIGTPFIYGEDGRKQYGQGAQKSLNEEGVATYDFVGGDPSFVQITSTGEEQNSFTKTINVSLEVNGQSVTWPADPTNDPQRAYVLGIQAIPGANFVTAAPETVEFILRDPPGSDSYAYREAGTTFSVSEEFFANNFGGVDGSLGAGVGFDIAGGGSFGGHLEGGGTIEGTAAIGMKFERVATTGATVERSLETTETITTNDQPIEIGASDVFVAKSHNLETGYAMRVQPLPLDECGGNCFGDVITMPNGNQFQMGVSVISYINPEGFPTYVVYTQNHIETVLIPDLIELRNTILAENPGFTSQLTPDHELYGTNNDDPKWGTLVSTSNYIKTEAADLTGASYTFNNGGDDTKVDSIRFFNQQIRLWEEALAFNEIEKWAAFNAGNQENVSLASGVQLERSVTNTASSVSMISLDVAMAVDVDLDISINAVVAVRANLDAELGLKTTSTSTRGQESANTFGYVLQDSDENDAYSIDIAAGVGGNSPVFSTVAGQTSCPFEPGLEMKYATSEFIDRAIIDRQAVIVKLTKSKNMTDILKTQIEEEIQAIQDDIEGLEADIKTYTESQIELIRAKADINEIIDDLQSIVKEIGENAANSLVQKAVGPVVGGVNDFIGTLQDIRIPVPFSSGISPFENIPSIPEPAATGDFAFDFSQLEDIMLKRLKDTEKIATETINRTTELNIQVQNRIKKRLLDLNNLTIRLNEFKLDLEKINNEIDAINQQIVQFQQLQGVLQSTTEPIMLSNATLQREKPTLQINGAKTAQVYNVPADESANFRLLLGNESESGDAQYYAIEVLDKSNPNGLVLRIDGETLNTPREFLVDGGSSITKVMTVERGPFEYDYEDVEVIIHSTCQYDPRSNTALIVDTVTFDVSYIPVCSNIAILSPQDNWVGNNISDGVLPVHIGEYDINSTGLEYIQIEYKASSSSDWLQVVRYYRDENIAGWADGDPTLPQTGNEFIYEWHFAEMGIVDGNYDLRVVANCDLAATESDIHSGLIDTVNPHLFGTPQPADGIYSSGDEIAIQFNEPINEGLIQPSYFEITGVLNGGAVRHDASVYFGGKSNEYMRIEQGINLTRKSFSIDMYVKRDGVGASVLLAQGGASDRSLVLGFDAADQPYMSVDGELLVSDIAITDDVWHHLAFVYDHANEDAIIYIDALENGIDNSYAQDYQSSGSIFLGKSSFGSELPFSGQVHELRIWNLPLSVAEVNIAATQRMTASQRGLIGNWRMEEATGEIARDMVRSKHAQVYGQWVIEPGGLAYNLDGINHIEASSPAFTSATDFTIEFWLKGAAVNDSVTFISNGRGDNNDSNGEGWHFGTDENSQLIIRHNNKSLETQQTILDNSWHHVAFTVNRIGNAVCYIDGEEVLSEPTNDLLGFGGSKLWFGARGWYEGTVENVDQLFTGSMDEIRIWSLAKRADHIQSEIQNKLNGNETGLVLYYPFESYQDIGGGIFSVSQDTDNQATTALAAENTLLGAAASHFVENTPTIKLPQPLQNVSFNYSSNNDQIILSPTVDAGVIENTTLTISLKKISDLNGNRLVSPITWTAYVDRSTLNWVEEEKDFDIALGEGVTFTAEIFNQGGNIEMFNLTNLPDWLSASPASGTVKPLTSQSITFTVSEGTNIGTYVQDIVMETSFGFDERLILNLNVYQNSPEDWVVNPQEYEYSMSVLNRIRIKGEFSRDESDLIAAFVNGECRGVASLEYITSQDNYQAYLSVYSNELTGESVNYRIWNASEGLVHTFVTNDASGVETFSADGFYGTILTPVIFDGGANIERTQEISSGWQWLSFNLTSTDFNTVSAFMAEFPSTEGDQVKSNQFYDQYDPVNGWVGTVSGNGGIQPGEMYKFSLKNAAKLKYRGEPVDPDINPIGLIEGWNWVSFLGQNLIPINQALANVTGLSVGDVIKSQREFATYGGSGVGWIGSLKVMEPGQGYMYRAAIAGDIVYPKVAATSRVQAPNYSYLTKAGLDATLFPDNMNMIVSTNVEYDYLLAMVGDEVRGIAMPEFNAVTGETAYFMTIFGDEPVALSFKGVYDRWEETLSVEEHVTFSGTNTYGTLAQPILMKGTMLNVSSSNFVNLYPNPVRNQLEIQLNSIFHSIKIISLSGKVFKSIEQISDLNKVLVDVSDLARGVYMVQLEGDQTISVKLIKE
ncbi:MAG: LamG-like jellyroll fold domain-containing protein, partial [Cyclobacteriaceae bacterium]